MSVALELRRAAVAAGQPTSFVATGQTGMMIEGWGVAVDRLISDFAQGTVEWLVEEGERLGDWVIVEGQGSLDHPAYSSVTLALIHGATPQAMVMVHKPGLSGARLRPPARRLVPDRRAARASSTSTSGWPASWHRRRSWPSRSTRRSTRTRTRRRRIIATVAAETGLPTDDPVRFGADRLWPQIRERVDALPTIVRP